MYSIVQKLGGDVFNGGNRALIPGPGHSANDRSISLMLGAGGKVRIHPFSDHDWREIMDWLKAENLVADDHTLIDDCPRSSQSIRVPSDTERSRAARMIWEEGRGLDGTLSLTWLRKHRKITRSLCSDAFRHGDTVPLKAYDQTFRFRHAAFLAKVVAPSGAHVGTEITYLDASARKAMNLRVPRKLIGSKPPGSSVPIDPVEDELVVAEGIPSALSASEHFSLPCHALLGVKSFPSWRPPAGVRRIVIAAEPDPAGRKFSARLYDALRGEGYDCQLEFPPGGGKDFNVLFGGQG